MLHIRSTTANWLIKLLVLALVAWAIYRQVIAKEHLDMLWGSFVAQWAEGRWHWMVLACVLMPVNWGIEALKLRKLTHQFMRLPFLRAFESVLAGVTVSIFTPNRVGEYGGRILFVESKYNWRVVVATLVGSLSQLLALLTTGLLGFLYFAWRFLELNVYMLQGVMLIGLTLIVLMLIAFLNVDLVVPIARRVSFFQRHKKYFRHFGFLQWYSRMELLQVLGLSVLRYCTYSLQFFFMLRFFGIDVPFGAAFAGISTVFLVQTSIPLPPVLGLLTRGQVALYVWSHFGGNELSVLASTYGIFVINLALPALLGAISIVKVNILKSLGYENDQL
jgi:hypothetical protein